MNHSPSAEMSSAQTAAPKRTRPKKFSYIRPLLKANKTLTPLGKEISVTIRSTAFREINASQYQGSQSNMLDHTDTQMTKQRRMCTNGMFEKHDKKNVIQTACLRNIMIKKCDTNGMFEKHHD